MKEGTEAAIQSSLAAAFQLLEDKIMKCPECGGRMKRVATKVVTDHPVTEIVVLYGCANCGHEIWKPK